MGCARHQPEAAAAPTRRQLLRQGLQQGARAGAVFWGLGLPARPAWAQAIKPPSTTTSATTSATEPRGAATPAPAVASANPLFERQLRHQLAQGSAVVMIRHALAPGTFDPPGFRLDDCATQRNLNEEGRLQAARIGQWFSAQQFTPARVRTSPWCRCMDTAMLAFAQQPGRALEPWAALGSTRGLDAAADTQVARAQAQTQLRQALAALTRRRRVGHLEVWVSHQFVIQALTSETTVAAEGVLLALQPTGEVKVAQRLVVEALGAGAAPGARDARDARDARG